MENMSLFTINIIEYYEDPEWVGTYKKRTSPTNRVFASFEDALNSAHEMLLKRISELELPEDDIHIQDVIVNCPNVYGYKVIMPWDNEEEISFIVVPLKWEE